MASLTLWTFLAAFTGLLVFDLYSNRGNARPTIRSAAVWSLFYIGEAIFFAGLLAISRGAHDAGLFLSGYIMEQALSVDNLMVFGAVFAYFGIAEKFQRRVLYYGIIGSAVLRLFFVLAVGGPLYLWGRPVEALLGLVVFWSALKIGGGGDEKAIDHSSRWYAKALRYVYPFATWWVPANGQFFDGSRGRRAATPMLLCLISIEVTDIMFAFDSVPVVVSVTRDPLLIYSAMMFAVMGLRSLYFLLVALQRYLRYLTGAVRFVLAFIATTLLAHAIFGLETRVGYKLIVILGVFAIATGLSLFVPKKVHP